MGFMGILFSCLVGCSSMTIWTPAVLSVLYAWVSYFCIFTCSAQLSMFHMERHSRNKLIIIIIITSSILPLQSCFANFCTSYYKLSSFLLCTFPQGIGQWEQPSDSWQELTWSGSQTGTCLLVKYAEPTISLVIPMTSTELTVRSTYHVQIDWENTS